MADNVILLRPEILESFLTELLENAGLERKNAAIFADKIVQTNLLGIDSHGVIRIPIYVRRLLTGTMKTRPQMRVYKSAKAVEVLDGDNAPGILVGHEAMKRAIELARKYNIGMVGAINSNHFGAACLYARMAAEEGMVGIAMTNVAPLMVAPGAGRPVVGNNPIAFAVPTHADFPIVLDISMSSAAMGKMLIASEKREKIPMDWATDENGQCTDDPDKAVKGFFIPIAGHKGFGLALIIDLLCGVITGGCFLHQLKGMYSYPDDPSVTAHLMLAINHQAILGPDELTSRMASFYKMVKETPMVDKSKEILLPGEPEYRACQERIDSGIPIPGCLHTELIELGKKLKVRQSLNC